MTETAQETHILNIPWVPLLGPPLEHGESDIRAVGGHPTSSRHHTFLFNGEDLLQKLAPMTIIIALIY